MFQRLCLSAAAALMFVACSPVEDAGGLLEPLHGGVLSQANLDGTVTLGSTAEAATPAPVVDRTPRPEPEPEAASSAESEQSGHEAEAEAEADADLEAEAGAEADRSAAPEAAVEADGSAAPEAAVDAEADVEAEAAVEPEAAAAPDAGVAAGTAPSPEAVPDGVDASVDTHADPRSPVGSNPAALDPAPAVAAAESVPAEAVETPSKAPPVESAPDSVSAEANSKAALTAGVDTESADRLPEAPRSDADAIAALDSVPRAQAPPAAKILAPVERCESDLPLVSTPITDLQMTRWWMELGKHRAELVDRAGAAYTIEIGDRVGPEGGKVVRIDPTEVIIGEIGFSLASEPQIVVRSIKLAR